MNMFTGNMMAETVRCYNDCSDFTLFLRIRRKNKDIDILKIEPNAHLDLSYEDVCDHGAKLTVFKGNLEWQVVSSISFLGLYEIRFYQLDQKVYWKSIEGTYLDRLRVSSKIEEYLKMKVKEVKDFVTSKQ
ncbi:hypothetical protein CsatB_025779 [Cannabis sativa]